MSKTVIQLKDSTNDSSIYPITDSRIVYHGEDRLSDIITNITDDLEDVKENQNYLNVNTLKNKTTPYGSRDAAHADVDVSYRERGMCITYMLNDASTWINEQFIGDSSTGWGTASNWKTLGPVSASQDASTGKTTIKIGTDSYDVATNPVSVSQNTLMIGGIATDIKDALSLGTVDFVGQDETQIIKDIPVISGHRYFVVPSSPIWEVHQNTKDYGYSAFQVFVNNINFYETYIYVGQEVMSSSVPMMAVDIPNGVNLLRLTARAKQGTTVRFNVLEYETFKQVVTQVSESHLSISGHTNLFTKKWNQGTMTYTGVDVTNTECIYCDEYFNIPNTDKLKIYNESQTDGNYWKIRVVFYDGSGVGIADTGHYYYRSGLNCIDIPSNAKFMRFAISLCSQATGTAIGCTPSDIPTDGTQLYYLSDDVKRLNDVIRKSDNIKDLDIFKLNLTQGSIYQGVIERSNTECICCEEYFNIDSLIENDVIKLHNEAQQDSKYWKIRMAFYNGNYGYISQQGYEYRNGASLFSVPSNAKYVRFAISLCNSSGYAVGCTPSDVPTDGTQMLISYYGLKQVESEIASIKKDISGLSSEQKPLPLNKMLGYSLTNLFSVESGYGDAACYNGHIFQFINGNEYVYVHSASDGTLEQTIQMPNPNAQYHNNSVSFGSEKYDANDEYPLLYASQENSAQNKCIVYRITGTLGNYEMTVVQTITFPTNAATGLYYHNCYIDTKNGYLILGGLRNSSWSATNGNILQYIIFNLPQLQSGDITLNIADAIKSSRLFTNMPTTQGGFCENGYLYQVYGVNAPQTLMVMDIANLIYCYIVNLTEEVGNFEPEGAFEYNDKLHIVFNGGAIYRMEH